MSLPHRPSVHADFTPTPAGGSICDAVPNCVNGVSVRGTWTATPLLIAASVMCLTSLLAACGGAQVTVTPPAVTNSATVDACSQLTESVPHRLLGLRLVTTSPASPLTAAWSDGANNVVVLRCGISSYETATSDILSVNDVDWSPVERERGTSFVTVGRTVNVQVDVPVSLRPEASYLVPLADAITAELPPGN